MFRASSIGRGPFAIAVTAVLLVMSISIMFSGNAAAVPPAIDDLVATAGDGQITLNWTEPDPIGSPITGYNVYRGNGSGNESLVANLGVLLSYTDVDVTNGTVYWYYVTAVDADGEGAASNEGSVMLYGSPLAPYGLVAAAGDTSVSLNWTSPISDGGSDIIGYAIYRGPAPGVGSLLVTIGNVTEYVDAGLENGETYWYHVSAINVYGTGDSSGEVSAAPVTVTTSPIGLTAVPGEDRIVLNWTAPLGVGGSSVVNYTVYRGTESWDLSVLTVLSDVLSYDDPSAVPGQAYYYRVSATNIAGESSSSDLVSAMIKGVPSAVVDLTAKVSDGEVRLSWTVPVDNGGSAITGYIIYRGSSIDDESVYRTIGPSYLGYLDDKVNNGQRYWYSIRAINTAGQGERSEHVAAVPVSAPSAPTGLTASRNGSAVTLKWNAPGDDGGLDVSNYGIYRGVDGGEKVKLVTVGSVLTYTDTSVVPGENYRYYVTALNEAGEGAASGEVSIVPSTSPSKPTGLAGTVGESNVTLTWTAPEDNGGSNVSLYRVFRDDGTGAVNIASVGTLTYVDGDIEDGHSYLYYVVAVNSNGAGASSDAVIVALDGTAVVEEDDGGSDMFLLPAVIVLAAALLIVSFLYVLQRKGTK
jgi:fibronectin type 3 domain-containing protein